MTPIYCGRGHKIRCEVWREGERLGTLVFFSASKTSGTYDERITRCPGCGERLGTYVLVPKNRC